MSRASGGQALVVGAGIVGLTSAVVLAESGYAVTVLSADPIEATTSAVAGALWGPWIVEPRHRVLGWAEQTLLQLRELAGHSRTGVRMASGLDVSNEDHEPVDWAHMLGDRRAADETELPPGYRFGHRYSAPLVDMPVYLQYLSRRLEAAGGEIRVGRVDALADIAETPVVVNCSGIGAAAIVPDPDLYPVRGDHLVVSNPGLEEFLEVDTGDSPDLIAIYPHSTHVVLGGTALRDRWDTSPDPATAMAIWRRCVAVEPRLAGAEILDHRVGLRPTRRTIRLEPERSGSTLVIHNYGHGGAGVSLAWGCAFSVAELVRDDNSA